jgi:hypothetical protein
LGFVGGLVILGVIASTSDTPDEPAPITTTKATTTTTKATTTTTHATTTTLLPLDLQAVAILFAADACATSAEFPIISPFEAAAAAYVLWREDGPPLDPTTETRLAEAIGREVRALCPELLDPES